MLHRAPGATDSESRLVCLLFIFKLEVGVLGQLTTFRAEFLGEAFTRRFTVADHLFQYRFLDSVLLAQLNPMSYKDVDVTLRTFGYQESFVTTLWTGRRSDERRHSLK